MNGPFRSSSPCVLEDSAGDCGLAAVLRFGGAAVDRLHTAHMYSWSQLTS